MNAASTPSPGHGVDREGRSPRSIACMEVWGGHEGFLGEVSVPGNDVYVGCTPHLGDAQGGDIYYVSNCAAGLITRFVLADVAGHGKIVAATAAGLRDLMRRSINTPDQSRFAEALNKQFTRESGRFATAVLVSYFAPTDHAIICNAGHPRPLHYSVSRGAWRFLDADVPDALGAERSGEVGASNLPLGVIDPTAYEQFAIRLDRGDLLLLYSDAFLEARGGDGKPWGEEGLLNVTRTATQSGIDASRLREQVLAEIARRTGEDSLDDDATMIVLHHNASDPPEQSLGERIVVLGKMLGLIR